MVLHVARQAARLAKTVVLYTNGVEDVTRALEVELAKTSRDIKVDSRVIRRLIKEEEKAAVTLEFGDGKKSTQTFLVCLFPV